MNLAEQIAKNGYAFEAGSYNDRFTKENKTILVFSHWNMDIESLLNKILNRFLYHLNRINLKNVVYNVAKENIINSVKANIKRIYFEKYHLNINDLEEYEKGMVNFKEEMLDNLEEYQEALQQNHFFVRVKFWYDSTHIMLAVENNMGILPQEDARIKERLQKAEEIKDISEAFLTEVDETEGAGLGLLLMVQLLKNEGLSLANYFIHTEQHRTETGLRIPFNSERQEQYTKSIAKKIMEHIDALPTFPSSIERIQQLIDASDASIEAISQAIQSDISIASNLLKLANSNVYSPSGSVETVERAIQLIGKDGLKEMLYSIGALEIMKERYASFEEIWKQSNESAFIARKLATKKGATMRQLSIISLGALLQDIGLVILFSLQPDTLQMIGKNIDTRQLPVSIPVEEAIIGISHATFGAIIANLWKFPTIVSTILEYHHLPFLVSEKDRIIIYSIYLANMMIEFKRGIDNIYQIEPEALEYFGFSNEGFVEYTKTFL